MKPGIDQTPLAPSNLCIAVKIITGDNRHAAHHVARAVGLAPVVITGAELAKTRDKAPWHLAESCNVCAKADPQQKGRIVCALQTQGHSVACLGDGLNDARGLRQGIVDGRQTFANTQNCIAITTSTKVGNMTSMVIGPLVLPFLPLTAARILLNTFLSDSPPLAVVSDRVDPETVAHALRGDLRGVRRYMVVFGLVGTLFGLLTVVVLTQRFGADQTLFQGTWFVVLLLTVLAVVIVPRTRSTFGFSRPGRFLGEATVAVGLLGWATGKIGWQGKRPVALPVVVGFGCDEGWVSPWQLSGAEPRPAGGSESAALG